MSEFEDRGFEQRLHHFISESPWSAEGVMADAARGAMALFEQLRVGSVDQSAASSKTRKRPVSQEVALVLDESGWPKKGQKSVGVQNQYCGQLGKNENCQIGVFAALSMGSRGILVNGKLFLPEKWSTDPVRMRRAGVPPEVIEQGHQKKGQLALSMVDEICQALEEAETGFDYVTGDCVYGKSPYLVNGLIDRNVKFVLDVERTRRIYLSDPAFQVPPSPGGKGRPPSVPRTREVDQSLEEWAKSLPSSAWEKVRIRQGTKENIHVRAVRTTAWLRVGNRVRQVQVLAIWRKGEAAPKFAISNYELTDSTLGEMARRQAQRFFIEQAFREVKQVLGMAEYQVRKWRAWHHHIALTILAHLGHHKYLIEEKWGPLPENMNLYIAREFITIQLMRTYFGEDDLLKAIENRIRSRESSYQNAGKE